MREVSRIAKSSSRSWQAQAANRQMLIVVVRCITHSLLFAITLRRLRPSRVRTVTSGMPLQWASPVQLTRRPQRIEMACQRTTHLAASLPIVVGAPDEQRRLVERP